MKQSLLPSTVAPLAAAFAALVGIAAPAAVQSASPVLPAAAGNGESDAIAQFMSIGFGSSAGGFASVKGASRGLDCCHDSLRSPDPTYFRDCEVDDADQDSGEGPVFKCSSVKRVVADDKLLAHAAPLVAANLSSAYKTDGPDAGASRPFQTWTSPGQPTIQIVVHREPGGVQYYILYMKMPG
jgi:hypothetical protein